VNIDIDTDQEQQTLQVSLDDGSVEEVLASRVRLFCGTRL